MKHGDAAMLVGLGLVILLQTASVVMLVADADPVALPPATSAYHELPSSTSETAAAVSLIGPPETAAPLAAPYVPYADDPNSIKNIGGWAERDQWTSTPLSEIVAPHSAPAAATITTGPLDRDADGYCPLDVAPLPARLDGTPTTEYALIELPKGTDQLVIEIQMLERSRGSE